MIKTDETITNIKNDILSLSWGNGAFYKAGFEYQALSVESGYPYFYITNLPVTASNVENTTTDFTHTFEIGIVHNFTVVELSTTETNQKKKRMQREETYRRSRRAFDFLRNYAIKNSTLAKWFDNSDNYMFEYDFNNVNIDELNLILCTIRIKVLEVQSKL